MTKEGERKTVMHSNAHSSFYFSTLKGVMYYLVDYGDCVEVHDGLTHIRDGKKRKPLTSAEVGMKVQAFWAPDSKWYAATVKRVSSKLIKVAHADLLPVIGRVQKTEAKVTSLSSFFSFFSFFFFFLFFFFLHPWQNTRALM